MKSNLPTSKKSSKSVRTETITKTIKDENGNITSIKTVKHGDTISTIKGVNIKANANRKDVVDTMREEGFKNKEIGDALNISQSRVSQIATSNKKSLHLKKKHYPRKKIQKRINN